MSSSTPPPFSPGSGDGAVQPASAIAAAATPVQQARAVTIPVALPYLFTGLRIASSLAVISALVAEYFGGPREGLGSAITTAAAGSAYARAWAFVIGAILLGLALFIVTSVLERIVSRHR